MPVTDDFQQIVKQMETVNHHFYTGDPAPMKALWSHANESVANRSFRTLDDLEIAQVERCVALQNQAERIRSLTHFHWWPPSSSKHQ